MTRGGGGFRGRSLPRRPLYNHRPMSDAVRSIPHPGPHPHPRSARPRPAWLRALGREDPPTRVTVAASAYLREHIYKHDSFAATALYHDPANPSHRIVCKFGRRQRVLGLPMAWLGEWLARRERAAMMRLSGITAVPRGLGRPEAAGLDPRLATAHAWVEGRPLFRNERVGDAFFPTLGQLIQQVHSRHAAYVDLNKRENILVGPDGLPRLIDFQLLFAASPGLAIGGDPITLWLMRQLQAADRYHLAKHWHRHRPDQVPQPLRDLDRLRPTVVRIWRRCTAPTRLGRRRLLVAMGVRHGTGLPDTEANPEEGVLLDRANPSPPHPPQTAHPYALYP